MVQFNLNFTHACGYMCARTCFTRVKVYNVECIFFVARGFLVRLNSRGTLDMHHMNKLVTSARSVNRQPHMAHHTNKLVTSTLNTRGASDMHHTNKLITNAPNKRGAPDMHHTNKLVTSASSLYKLLLLRSTTVAILLNKNPLQIYKALQVN